MSYYSYSTRSKPCMCVCYAIPSGAKLRYAVIGCATMLCCVTGMISYDKLHYVRMMLGDAVLLYIM
eukprot:9392235-Pyramimonas_sp.AAC.1